MQTCASAHSPLAQLAFGLLYCSYDQLLHSPVKPPWWQSDLDQPASTNSGAVQHLLTAAIRWDSPADTQFSMYPPLHGGYIDTNRTQETTKELAARNLLTPINTWCR